MQSNPLHATPSMKTHIMFRRHLTALPLAAVLILPAAPARAQTNLPAKGQPIAPVQYDLEIQSGMLWLRNPANPKADALVPADMGRIVKLLREKHNAANIAMAPELIDVDIGDLKLYASSVAEELEALRVAS